MDLRACTRLSSVSTTNTLQRSRFSRRLTFHTCRRATSSRPRERESSIWQRNCWRLGEHASDGSAPGDAGDGDVVVTWW